MTKIYLNANLIIVGTVAGLIASSFLGDALAQSMMPIDTYGAAPYQSTTPHNLGTLRQSDVDGSPSVQPTNAAAYGQQPAYAAPATSPDNVLQPMQTGHITYVTGGIGDEERAALHASEKDYNFRLMSSSHDGAFVGDTHLIIRSHSGDTLLDTTAGPLFFAKLPDGIYALEATHDGAVKKQTIKVRGSRPVLVHMGW